MNNYFFLVTLVFITVVLNTVAQTFLKLGAGQGLLNIYLLGGIFVYALSTVIYIQVLSKQNLSITYPVVIGLTVAATTFSGAFFLNEKVPTTHWLGIGLMLSGICAIAFGKSL